MSVFNFLPQLQFNSYPNTIMSEFRSDFSRGRGGRGRGPRGGRGGPFRGGGPRRGGYSDERESSRGGFRGGRGDGGFSRGGRGGPPR